MRSTSLSFCPCATASARKASAGSPVTYRTVNVGEVERYYLGYSNKCLWPLFHYFQEYCEFSGKQWEVFRDVNRKYADSILQEYVHGLEFGLFYVRRPSEERGRIFSITEKRLPVVTGDGERSLEELILDDERAVFALCRRDDAVPGPATRGDPLAGERRLAHERLADICRDAGIGYVDTTPVLAADVRQRGTWLHFPDDAHPTPEGHRVIADVVAGYLRENGLAATAPDD